MPVARGRLASVNVSNGGVPKRARPWAVIGTDGVEGDRQRDRRYHGGPERAVSLYSLERLEALRAEGHPIAAGSTGENLTIAGLDWAEVGPGGRLAVGAVLLEVTKPAHPCKTIVASFRGGDVSRISEKVHPGWSRFYARVLRGGTVHVGEPVVLSPAEG